MCATRRPATIIGRPQLPQHVILADFTWCVNSFALQRRTRVLNYSFHA